MPNIEIPKLENPESLSDVFIQYYQIVKILRENCPWDKEQTIESIAPLMIEETYEFIEAIHNKKYTDAAKELGDLLLHIVMHSIIAEENGYFNMLDVIKSNAHKMIIRHPHVFADVEIDNESDVTRNWEKIKKTKEGQISVLDGVPKSMPSLLRAERIQHKASRIGFDWNNEKDVWNKVYEELEELKTEIENNDKEKTSNEFGDFIFALVNLSRHLGIVAEDSLMKTNNKFTNRFKYIELKAKELNKDLNSMSLEEMDKLWDEAKSKGI